MTSESHKAKISEYLGQEKESAAVDFKGGFDGQLPAWCELIKDLIAFANSGGGVIIYGLDDDGNPSAMNFQSLLDADPANISNKINKYTQNGYADFQILSAERKGHAIACLFVGGVHVPIVFSSPGEYENPATREKKTAFRTGTVYFRHGAKSEPGTTEDLRLFLERELDRIRDSWLTNIRKVVEAPTGSTLVVVPSENAPLTSQSVRLSDDLSAPLVRSLDPNKTHPFRAKELTSHINERFSVCVNHHHIRCVRKVHEIDSKPHFCYKPAYSSPQYSHEFLEWLSAKFKNDGSFFESAVKECQKFETLPTTSFSTDLRLIWLTDQIRKQGNSCANMGRKLGVSGSTISLLINGKYPGKAEKILQAIEHGMGISEKPTK